MTLSNSEHDLISNAYKSILPLAHEYTLIQKGEQRIENTELALSMVLKAFSNILPQLYYYKIPNVKKFQKLFESYNVLRDLDSYRKVVKEFREIISLLHQHREDDYRKTANEYIVAHSLDLNTSLIRLPREFPIRIYISDKTSSIEVTVTIEFFLHVNGSYVTYEYEPVENSWFQKIIAKTYDQKTKSELIDDFKKAKRALEIYGIEKPQSDVDKNEAEAAAALIKSLDSIETAAIQLGSILLIKDKSKILVRTLSQKELQHLENNPQIVNKPTSILKELNNLQIGTVRREKEVRKIRLRDIDLT